jgi:hypothetical protein
MTRAKQGVLVFAGVIVGISLILSAAVAWGPHHDCTLQIPKIIGCALGSYESLSGGLIAAGGALFAGWLAWSAVKEQIRLEKQKMLEVKLDDFQRRAAEVSREISSLKTAYSNGQSLLTLLHEGRRDPSPNASKLLDLCLRQAFPASGDGLVSQTLGTRLWEAALRVREMAKQIATRLETVSADMQPSLLAKFEPNAMEAVEFFNSVLHQLPDMIQQKEAEVAEERQRIKRVTTELHSLSGKS